MQIVINNKTGKKYEALCYVTNRTNANDGQKMFLYCDESGALQCRELNEFHEKFTFSDEKGERTMLFQDNFKLALEKAANWEATLTEEERTTLTYVEAKDRAINKIFSSHKDIILQVKQELYTPASDEQIETWAKEYSKINVLKGINVSAWHDKTVRLVRIQVLRGEEFPEWQDETYSMIIRIFTEGAKKIRQSLIINS